MIACDVHDHVMHQTNSPIKQAAHQSLKMPKPRHTAHEEERYDSLEPCGTGGQPRCMQEALVRRVRCSRLTRLMSTGLANATRHRNRSQAEQATIENQLAGGGRAIFDPLSLDARSLRPLEIGILPGSPCSSSTGLGRGTSSCTGRARADSEGIDCSPSSIVSIGEPPLSACASVDARRPPTKPTLDLTSFSLTSSRDGRIFRPERISCCCRPASDFSPCSLGG